jgi:hypothetical protein
MLKSLLDRRRFLLGSALGAAGATLLDGAFNAARAFSMQPMSPETKAAYLAAKSCGNDQAYHDTITQVVLGELNKLPAPPAGQSISQTVKCPLCGCPVVVTRAGS